MSSEYSPITSEHSGSTNSERDCHGRLITPHLDAPIIDDLARVDIAFRTALEHLAEEPRQKERLSAERMERVILSLCRDHFMALSALAQLANRNPDGLRQQYLTKMVRAGQMVLAFPTKPTHEKQAYRAAEGSTPDPDEDYL